MQNKRAQNELKEGGVLSLEKQSQQPMFHVKHHKKFKQVQQ